MLDTGCQPLSEVIIVQQFILKSCNIKTVEKKTSCVQFGLCSHFKHFFFIQLIYIFKLTSKGFLRMEKTVNP